VIKSPEDGGRARFMLGWLAAAAASQRQTRPTGVWAQLLSRAPSWPNHIWLLLALQESRIEQTIETKSLAGLKED